ncbi:Clp protease N-terminal domain-containing protein [Nocardiopsis oceani]
MGTNTRTGLGQVYLDANSEALLRGDRKVSTEHVILALLRDADSPPARALGVELTVARQALESLDEDALAAIGISTMPAGAVLPGQASDRLPLTPAAKAVFKGLRGEAGRERIGLEHVLRALLNRRHPDPAAALLDTLDVDRTAVRARLTER